MPPCLRAFTLVELLVVIAIIGLLIGAIAFVGVKLIGQQRARYSETILRTVAAAIDQFANENPLRQLYNKPGAATFGPFPPYAIDGTTRTGTVLGLFPEPNSPPPIPDLNAIADNSLGNRLWRDFAGNNPLTSDMYVGDELLEPDHLADPQNDNRALFTYLAVYGGGVLNQVPPDRLKPLHVEHEEVVNPTGRGADPNNPRSGAITVLGIHDAWDVPIEYFLNVKIEVASNKTGLAIWQIADRQPVVASRGMSREEYDALASDPNEQSDVSGWIFSQPLPTPLVGAADGTSSNAYTNLRINGALPARDPKYNGWLRARGRGDVLPFLP